MKKQNIIIIGMAATGKTTIGKLLAETLHKEFIDLDKKIEQNCGVDVETIFAIEGEEGFRIRETNELQKILASSDNYILSLGGGTVILSQNREMIRAHAHLIVQLYSSDLNVLAERIAQSPNKRPLLSQVDDIALKLQQLYTERAQDYDAMTDIKIDIATLKPMQAIHAILEHVGT